MLSDQRILVTGANGGIGASICEELLNNNANLVLLYNNKKDRIDKLLQKYGDSIEAHKIDLLDSKKLTNVLNSIMINGGIDSFIHSVVHPIQNKDIMKTIWDDFQLHIDLQAKTFLQILQTIVPTMKEKKRGKIINILTSYTVGNPPNKMSHYVTGKYALLGLSKALAIELGSSGITVNCISPSMTNTDLIANLPAKLKEITTDQVPLKRLAEPHDVASIALFLCSKNSGFINGENILVTGGSTMH